MEYIALYRRYRPKNFSEIIGQDNIVTILKNQISMEKISHAYLFCGTRGTGKTSAAKIFAKAVNCEQNDNGEPCGICNVCKNIEKSSIMDIIEIDAASNRGVDEIRELREKVKYPPTLGTNKVYIIDEVHMLTQEAFNALLKTLEEPPKHVIFILATTEPNKLPTTILSRCQRFNFKRIEIKDIISKMSFICEELNVRIHEKTLRLIAKNSDGAMRDALSILEQCLSISINNEVCYENVRDLMGLSDDNTVYSIVETIIDKDVNMGLTYLEDAYKNGQEISQLVNQLILCFRDILIYKITNKTDNLNEITEENQVNLMKLGNKIEKKYLGDFIEMLSDMENKIKYSTLPKVLMEVIMIKLCCFNTDDIVQKNKQHSINLKTNSYHKQKKEVTEKNEKAIEKNEELVSVKANTRNTEKIDWDKICKSIIKKKPLVGTSLQMGKASIKNDDIVEIIFDKKDSIHLISIDKNKSFIEEEINNIYNKAFLLQCKIEEDNDMIKLAKNLFGHDKVHVIED